jgi:hypothetical protein
MCNYPLAVKCENPFATILFLLKNGMFSKFGVSKKIEKKVHFLDVLNLDP